MSALRRVTPSIGAITNAVIPASSAIIRKSTGTEVKSIHVKSSQVKSDTPPTPTQDLHHPLFVQPGGHCMHKIRFFLTV